MNMQLLMVVPEFLWKHTVRLVKRYVSLCLLRGFNIGSLYSTLDVVLCLTGIVLGGMHWAQDLATGLAASSCTVMPAGLPQLVGIQFLMAFLHYDVSNVPNPKLTLTADISVLPHS